MYPNKFTFRNLLIRATFLALLTACPNPTGIQFALGQELPPQQSETTPSQTESPGTFSISSKTLTRSAVEFDSPLTLGLPARHPDKFTKRDSDFASSLHSVTDKNHVSVVRLEGPDDEFILGTLVSTNGMVVSKYSVAKEMQLCVFQDGLKWPFRIVGFDEKKDLCLIRVNRRGLTPIKFRSDLGQQSVNARQQGFDAVNLIPPSSGSLALSVGYRDKIAGFGMVTMGLHDFKIQQPQCADCVDMGITVSPYPSLTRINGIVYPYRKGIKVLRVYPRSVGERVGLLVGDLIRTVNGATIFERQILDRETRKIRAGDMMTMKIFRRGNQRELTYKLPKAKKTLHDRWGGGPYSDRRFGFGPVIVHDSVIAPEDCGGPLVDVQGNVIGINISRSMRVASFAINIEDVFLFIKSRAPETRLLFRE